MITKKQAEEKLHKLISNKNLIKHCYAVSYAMKAYAKHFGIKEKKRQLWEIAGLIHDADWEKYPDKHPKIIASWLAKENADYDLINAVLSHGFNFNVAPKTLMAKTLRAVDELTGLIVAVALVKGKKLSNVNLTSIKKKWNQHAFAKGVNRKDIEKGAKEINVPLDTHISIVLDAMKAHAKELGL